MKINFILPSKTRPNKFFNTVENLKEMCMTDNYECMAVLDESDLTMNNQKVREQLNQYPFLKPYFINSIGKIDAINKGLQFLSPDYDIMVLISDDFLFIEKGFDWHIINDMKQWFPDLSGLLHYPDGIAQVADRQITMAVMGKGLIDRFNYIYHPSYKGVWCDNEQLNVVKLIKKHKFINRQMFIHNHPAWGKSENDALYKHNESFYYEDQANFFKRQAKNFDL